MKNLLLLTLLILPLLSYGQQSKETFVSESGHFSLEYPSSYKEQLIQNAPHMLLKLDNRKCILSVSMWSANYISDDYDLDLWQDEVFLTLKKHWYEKNKNRPDYFTKDFKKYPLNIKGKTIHAIEIDMTHSATLPDGSRTSISETCFQIYHRGKMIQLYTFPYTGESKGLDVWCGLQLY